MKKRLFTLTTTAMVMLGALLSTGCSSYYFPQMGRMPLHTQQGELVAEVGIPQIALGAEMAVGQFGLDGCILYQASCSYAVTDHLAVQLSSRNIMDPRHQVMVGWYNPLSEHATFEVYGGYAYQKCSYVNDAMIDLEGYSDYRLQGNAPTVFVQGDIGFPSYKPAWSNRIEFTAGAGLRAGGVLMNYHRYDYERVYDGTSSSVVMTGEGDYSAKMFELQPMVQLGVGGPRWKIEIGACYSLMLGPGWPTTYPFSTNLSVTYRIPLLNK